MSYFSRQYQRLIQHHCVTSHAICHSKCRGNGLTLADVCPRGVYYQRLSGYWLSFNLPITLANWLHADISLMILCRGTCWFCRYSFSALQMNFKHATFRTPTFSQTSRISWLLWSLSFIILEIDRSAIRLYWALNKFSLILSSVTRHRI